jgi:hypothetical protein
MKTGRRFARIGVSVFCSPQVPAKNPAPFTPSKTIPQNAESLKWGPLCRLFICISRISVSKILKKLSVLTLLTDGFGFKLIIVLPGFVYPL